MTSQLKKNPLLKIINNSLIELPVPSNISLWWNFGSLAGICLMTQITSGLLLTFWFWPNAELAFDSMNYICQEVNGNWWVRTTHANSASLFFFCLYFHIGRGLYYQSYKYTETWSIGVLMFLMAMGTAFLGYVLPWGQMSFWGTSVITNLLSVIPYVGSDIVAWVWGGPSVNSPTLTRFFGLHFFLPFLITALAMIHLLFLHQTGSNNPLGLNSNKSKITFYPYYFYKDLVGFIILFMILTNLIMFFPYLLNDSDNFIPANPMMAPAHIQPEWYFLFAYAILRSISNKLGGVIALLMSILILFFMPLVNKNKFQGTQFYPMSKWVFWIFTCTILLLTWIGMRPVETPYVLIGQILTLMYFSLFLVTPLMLNKWDSLIN